MESRNKTPDSTTQLLKDFREGYGANEVKRVDNAEEIKKHGELNKDLLNNVKFHHLKNVRALIAAGADVNYQDEDGVTPLMVAAARNFPISEKNTNDKKRLQEYLAIAELLLEHKAEINAQDKAGRTALMYVGLNDHFFTNLYTYPDRNGDNFGRGEMSKLLFRKRALTINLKLTDNQDKTAWHYLTEDALERTTADYNGSHDGIYLLAYHMQAQQAGLKKFSHFQRKLQDKIDLVTRIKKIEKEEQARTKCCGCW